MTEARGQGPDDRGARTGLTSMSTDWAQGPEDRADWATGTGRGAIAIATLRAPSAHSGDGERAAAMAQAMAAARSPSHTRRAVPAATQDLGADAGAR